MQLPRGDQALARRHRDWLKSLPDRTGKSLSHIASVAKVSGSTLYRPLQEGDDGTSTLHARTIQKIVEATGVEPPGGVARAPSAGRRPIGLGEDAAPYVPDPKDPVDAALGLLIGQRNGLAPFAVRSRALELAGLLVGDVVIVDLNAVPAAGDLVVAQVYDWQNGTAKTVLRAFEPAGAVNILVSRSLETNDALVVDQDRVIVKGVILPHRLRPTSRAA